MSAAITDPSGAWMEAMHAGAPLGPSSVSIRKAFEISLWSGHVTKVDIAWVVLIYFGHVTTRCGPLGWVMAALSFSNHSG